MKSIDPSRTGCGIEYELGLQCFNALLLELYTCQTVSNCNIVTHVVKKWLILFVTVMSLHLILVNTSRQRVVWVSPGESGTYHESLKYL